MCYDKSIDPLVLASISFWAKEGGKGRGGKGYIEGREGGERTVQLFDAPMIKVSFVFRSPD